MFWNKTGVGVGLDGLDEKYWKSRSRDCLCGGDDDDCVDCIVLHWKEDGNNIRITVNLYTNISHSVESRIYTY